MENKNITLKECHDDKKICKQFKKLYKSAFPKNERVPFLLLKNRAKKNFAQMLSIMKNGEFVGLAYIISNEKIAYLFFFAIKDELRGKGLGSLTLKAIKEKYKGKTIFLARERLDEPCDNLPQRQKRREFYLRNGFSDMPLSIIEPKMTYDVMSVGDKLAPEDYNLLFKNWCEKFKTKMIDSDSFKN